ncbi:glycosyltransferase [Alkalicoccus halolimnae]|uniref:Glycosyltransferase n=1 Tax=Alkalicoccus halolimnae TaxID=1667239 RepID=A0A5C7F8H4_9BACI|nr:glycosyltransferase [Alkalicoccus halolimnae]TXF87011.1 glycosyltransferase [Alkalicoccus halolimnae]
MNKVLFLSAFIPHYREELIKQLSKDCSLTVTSLDLEKLNLISLKENQNNSYKLINTKSIKIVEKFFKISIVPKEINLASKNQWDTIFAFYSLRYPHRLIIFLWYKLFSRKTNWIWVGHIYGNNTNFLVKFLRKVFLNSSDGVLTYTTEYVEKLKKDGINVDIQSFNNTSVKLEDIKILPLKNINNKMINILFVGRYQKRKKIERLIYLAKRREDVNLRLIGPGMETLQKKVRENNLLNRVSIYGAKTGEELEHHFKWSHIVANPGHVGLLVVTAGQYGRPIIIDNQSSHAPEYVIAEKTEQFFIDWGNDKEVDKTINFFKSSPSTIVSKGKQLSDLIKKEYTVENSVKSFTSFLKNR